MNASLETKIKSVIMSCKDFAAQAPEQKVLDNSTENTNQQVYDEFARQINYTNQVMQKKKDLQYLVVILTEAKNGLSSNTPNGAKVLNVIDGYLMVIKNLLSLYKTLEDSQYWILTYYNKGGGQQF